jgi:hypothetical protein
VDVYQGKDGVNFTKIGQVGTAPKKRRKSIFAALPRNISWDVPNETGKYSIKVVAWNGLVKVGEDQSQISSFTGDVSKYWTYVEAMELTFPDGGPGVDYPPGSVLNVSFDTYELREDAARAEYSLMCNNYGTKTLQVWTQAFTSNSTYNRNITLPNVVLSGCKMKVTLKNGSGALVAADQSESTFRIQP